MSYLKGDAKKAVSHLALDALNYEAAISTLDEHFSNNKKMAMIYVYAVMDAKKVEQWSPSDRMRLIQHYSKLCRHFEKHAIQF